MTVELFSPPDGDFISNPDMQWLENLVLNGGTDYWNAGAGQGSLKYENAGTSIQLLLTFAEKFGFYLEFIDPDNTYFVSLSGGSFDDSVTVYVGGDPFLLPAAFFVSTKSAWAAVKQFCETGERSEAITWGRRSELNWHYGYDET